MKKLIDKCLSILDQAFGESNEIGGGVNYRYYHGLRTMKACKKILNSQELVNTKVNKKALLIAALFHDIGKVSYIEADGTLQGDRSKDEISHEELGARILPKYLENVISESDIKQIANIIRNQHDLKSNFIETRILHDADVLDSIGLINVWRMFTYSGKKARSLEETLIYYKEISKDIKRNEHLYFSVTKTIAKRRRYRLKGFILDFEKEYKYQDF